MANGHGRVPSPSWYVIAGFDGPISRRDDVLLTANRITKLGVFWRRSLTKNLSHAFYEQREAGERYEMIWPRGHAYDSCNSTERQVAGRSTGGYLFEVISTTTMTSLWKHHFAKPLHRCTELQVEERRSAVFPLLSWLKCCCASTGHSYVTFLCPVSQSAEYRLPAMP